MKLEDILREVGYGILKVKVQDGKIVSIPEQEIQRLSKTGEVQHKIVIKDAIEINGE